MILDPLDLCLGGFARWFEAGGCFVIVKSLLDIAKLLVGCPAVEERDGSLRGELDGLVLILYRLIEILFAEMCLTAADVKTRVIAFDLKGLAVVGNR